MNKLSLGVLVFFLIGLPFIQLEAMQYYESMNIDDLMDIFGDDNCMEGIFSTSEFGGPIIKSLSFIESEHATSLTGSENNTTDSLEGKSPMSWIMELATFNGIKCQYRLTDEDGPSHKKLFVVRLELGEEEFYGEGSSIKRAQHQAARSALNSTLYPHPPNNPNKETRTKIKSTPEQLLNVWARKHGDAAVKYSYIQQSKIGFSDHHSNNYHKGMYSKAENIHRVTVKIEDQEFSGEGPSINVAKQKAASNALKQLQNAEGFCMLDDSVKSLFSQMFDSNSEASPISLVFEFASISKMTASFDLFSEEGPAHMKTFQYKCSVGDNFETFGEGKSKKAAKFEAAKKMIQKLKSHAPYNGVNCGGSLMKNRKLKKKRSTNLIKSVTGSHLEDSNTDFSIPDDANPISKLFEIQQKLHSEPPIFSVVEEKVQSNSKEFFIKVTVGEMHFVGSGTNKKIAKRKAAEGMLSKMGYSTVSGKIRLSSSESKRSNFEDESKNLNKKNLVPGLHLKSEKFSNVEDENPSIQHLKSKAPATFDDKGHKSKDGTKDRTSNSKKSPKVQLSDLSKDLGFRFQFSDFPKSYNRGFVSMVSMTTQPPKVCWGEGVSAEQSQESAALSALEMLYKREVNTVSQLLSKPNEDHSATENVQDTDHVMPRVETVPVHKT